MADPNWRTNPDIQLAKQICQEKQAAAAIIVWVLPTGAFGVASYGTDGEKCKRTGRIADQIHKGLIDGTINAEDLMDHLYGVG